jgi:hypothetical protein
LPGPDKLEDCLTLVIDLPLLSDVVSVQNFLSSLVIQLDHLSVVHVKARHYIGKLIPVLRAEKLGLVFPFHVMTQEMTKDSRRAPDFFATRQLGLCLVIHHDTVGSALAGIDKARGDMKREELGETWVGK